MSIFDIVWLVVAALCTAMNINTFRTAVNTKSYWLYFGALIAQTLIFYSVIGTIRTYYPNLFG